MMKQKITFKLCLAMLGLLLSFSAGAANKEGEVIIEQLKYTLYDDGTASVASAASKASDIKGEIVIIESIEKDSKTYSVTTIDNDAFFNCTGLTAITIPNSVTTIGNYAFYTCTGLTAITIPNNVTTIGNYAFGYCKLTAITIPNKVTTIGNYAFRYCTELTAITIPNSVTTIGKSVFYNCSGLTSITIPNSVTTIGNSAFEKCIKLTSITIPNSVTTIGEGVFSGCSGLQEIKVYVETPITITDKVFLNVNYSTCTLYVPKGSIDKYKAAAVWNKFLTISALADGSAIEGIDEDKLNVYSVDGKVVIKNLREGEAISICNTTGQNVYQGNETEVPLSKGIYFVKVGTIVSKVMVQ